MNRIPANRALMAQVADEAQATSESLRRELAFVDSFGTRNTERGIAHMMSARPATGDHR